MNAVPLVAGTWVDGVVQAVKIAHTNTGASTYAPDGLTAIPIYGLGLQPLQGGELLLNGTAILMHATIAGVNSGNPICVLMECAGGAQQVAPATASQHAAQFGQLGMFQGVGLINSNLTLTSAGYGKIYQPPTGSAGGYTIAMPPANIADSGKTLTVFNSSSGNITLTAGNFNTAYGGGTSIVIPAFCTIQLEHDGVSHNGIGGAGAIGAAVRPTNTAGIGQWQGMVYTGSSPNSYFTLPSGGSWAYFCSNNGFSSAGVAAGGSNVMGPFTPSAAFGFCWRLQ